MSLYVIITVYILIILSCLYPMIMGQSTGSLYAQYQKCKSNTSPYCDPNGLFEAQYSSMISNLLDTIKTQPRCPCSSCGNSSNYAAYNAYMVVGKAFGDPGTITTDAKAIIADRPLKLSDCRNGALFVFETDKHQLSVFQGNVTSQKMPSAVLRTILNATEAILQSSSDEQSMIVFLSQYYRQLAHHYYPPPSGASPYTQLVIVAIICGIVALLCIFALVCIFRKYCGSSFKSNKVHAKQKFNNRLSASSIYGKPVIDDTFYFVQDPSGNYSVPPSEEMLYARSPSPYKMGMLPGPPPRPVQLPQLPSPMIEEFPVPNGSRSSGPSEPTTETQGMSTFIEDDQSAQSTPVPPPKFGTKKPEHFNSSVNLVPSDTDDEIPPQEPKRTDVEVIYDVPMDAREEQPNPELKESKPKSNNKIFGRGKGDKKKTQEKENKQQAVKPSKNPRKIEISVAKVENTQNAAAVATGNTTDQQNYE